MFNAIYYSQCILELSECMFWNIWTWSLSFLCVQELTFQVALKKTKLKLDLLTDTDILLMIEKSIRGYAVRSIRGYAIHEIYDKYGKYMKDYDENKESLHFKYWDVNNIYEWTMT